MEIKAKSISALFFSYIVILVTRTIGTSFQMLTYVMQSSIERLAFKAQSDKKLADIMDLHILRKL